MAAAGEIKGAFKQDMVVSIRYRNDLPPPPMPPKFLDIDNGGIAQYLTTSFASAMARREEPNIEVDAEGGMPIDMVGIPGYFLGDESAILAPDILPVLDPADHALMLTPDQLRNQDSKTTNVSFLRRTQYMSSQNARTNDPLIRTNPRITKSINNRSALPAEMLARDDKENIRRHIQKGFDIAYPESIPYNGPETRSHPSTNADRDAWRNPVHPDNPKLKPVSYHPVIPYFNTATDGNGFASIKFDKPPLPAIGGRRDDRIDVSIMKAKTIDSLYPAWLAKKAAYDKNPDLYEDPGFMPLEWSLCVPSEPDAVSRVRKAMDDADPNKDDEALYDGLTEGRPQLLFEKIRSYPLFTEQSVSSKRFMAISLMNQDRASNGLRPQGDAAYYYPIFQRTRYRADRGRLGRANAAREEDESDQNYNFLSVQVREPTANEAEIRASFRGVSDPVFRNEYAKLESEAKAAEAAKEAQEVIDEQGPLQGGEQDVTMDEVEAADKMELATNGVFHRESDRAVDDDEDEDAMADE